jgi:hypothetical protein
MAVRWPNFDHEVDQNGYVEFIGAVRPFQKEYEIGIWWKVGSEFKPWVYLINPRLTPRVGQSYEQIPHLLYYEKNPEMSGLCLFDPDGDEWSNKLLIANTTLPWAVEWLQFYEFWHFDGIWRGKSVGPESIAEIRASTVHK